MKKEIKVGDMVKFHVQGSWSTGRVNKIFMRGKFKGHLDVGRFHFYVLPEDAELVQLPS